MRVKNVREIIINRSSTIIPFGRCGENNAQIVRFNNSPVINSQPWQNIYFLIEKIDGELISVPATISEKNTVDLIITGELTEEVGSGKFQIIFENNGIVEKTKIFDFVVGKTIE